MQVRPTLFLIEADTSSTQSRALNKEETMIKDNQTKAEAQIRDLIEKRVQAVHDKDLNALMSNHAPDVLSFDVLEPLQNSGADTIRRRAERWFALYQSAIGYEVRDLNVTAGDEVAFCSYLYHVTGTQQGGANVDMWVRATVCLHKMNDKWLIVHEHQSVPFNPETGKASLDLKP
jgi:uncharacterized protein (TIGR02246 family)